MNTQTWQEVFKKFLQKEQTKGFVKTVQIINWIEQNKDLIGAKGITDITKWVDAEIDRYKDYTKEDSGYNYAIIALKDLKQYVLAEIQSQSLISQDGKGDVNKKV